MKKGFKPSPRELLLLIVVQTESSSVSFIIRILCPPEFAPMICPVPWQHPPNNYRRTFKRPMLSDSGCWPMDVAPIGGTDLLMATLVAAHINLAKHLSLNVCGAIVACTLCNRCMFCFYILYSIIYIYAQTAVLDVLLTGQAQPDHCIIRALHSLAADAYIRWDNICQFLLFWLIPFRSWNGANCWTIDFWPEGGQGVFLLRCRGP